METSKAVESITEKIILQVYVSVCKRFYKEEIKGDLSAGQLIGVSSDTMKHRRYQGFYRDGYHYYKKSDKIVMWNRDALLLDWSLQNGNKALFSA